MVATAWQHTIIAEHAKHNLQNCSSPQGVPEHLHRVQPEGTALQGSASCEQFASNILLAVRRIVWYFAIGAFPSNNATINYESSNNQNCFQSNLNPVSILPSDQPRHKHPEMEE